MKYLSAMIGTSLLALSGIGSINIAQAGSHTVDRYMAPYSSHGKRQPVCKSGYKVKWYKRVAYCEKNKFMKPHSQQNSMRRMQQGHKGNGFVIWDMKNGRKVARCKPGYKLNHKSGKYYCVSSKKGKGFVIWGMRNGRKVASCSPGYKLNHKFGKYSCIRNPRGNGKDGFLLDITGYQKQQGNRAYRKDKKYDQYLRWNGYKASCAKGKFWVEGKYKNIVHCSSK